MSVRKSRCLTEPTALSVSEKNHHLKMVVFWMQLVG